MENFFLKLCSWRNCTLNLVLFRQSLILVAKLFTPIYTLACRRAHHRRRPLQPLRQPPLQLHHHRCRPRHRPDPQRRVRHSAARRVWVALQQRHRRAYGPRQPRPVWFPLLRQPQTRPWPVPLRRRTARRPPRRRHDPRADQGRVLPAGIQERRAQDGPRRRAHRRAGRDQEKLQGRQLVNWLVHDYIYAVMFWW